MSMAGTRSWLSFPFCVKAEHSNGLRHGSRRKDWYSRPLPLRTRSTGPTDSVRKGAPKAGDEATTETKTTKKTKKSKKADGSEKTDKTEKTTETK
jgi:hypothetical protein